MKIKFALLILFLLMLNAKGQTILNVGPGQTYTTIGTAYASIPNTITGPYIIKLKFGYSASAETFPITLSHRDGMSSSNTVTLIPDTSGIVIASASLNGTLRIDSGQYVTIDGRVSGSGNTRDLKIINSNTSGFAVQFINGSSNCNLQYCRITGVDTSLNSGVVDFAEGSNTNNVVSHNEINGAPTQTARNLVYSSSANGMNSFNTIEENEFFNFYQNTGSSAIHIAGNNSYWFIRQNSIYETNTFTMTPSISGEIIFKLIWIDTPNGNHFEIEGNYIGGSAANAGGSPLTLTASATWSIQFSCIQTSFIDVDDTVFVRNNIMRNIFISPTYYATSSLSGCSNSFANGIIIVKENIIGDSTVNNSIVFHAGAMSVTLNFSGIGGADIVENNVVAGIALTGPNQSDRNFTGIGARQSVKGNLIGSYTMANSIDFGIAPSPWGGSFKGIVGAITIDSVYDNIISNIRLTGVVGTSSIDCIGIDAYNTRFVSGNTIRNIHSSGSFRGIDGTAFTITGNNIENIVNTEGGEMIGIYTDIVTTFFSQPLFVLENRIIDLTNKGHVDGIKIMGHDFGNYFPCSIKNNTIGNLQSDYGVYSFYFEESAVIGIALHDYFPEHHVDSNIIYNLQATSSDEPLVYGILVMPKSDAQIVTVDYNRITNLYHPGNLPLGDNIQSIAGIMVYNYDSSSFDPAHTNYSISHNIVDSVFCSGTYSGRVSGIQLRSGLSSFAVSHNTVSNIRSSSLIPLFVDGIVVNIASMHSDTVISADISYNTVFNIFQHNIDGANVKTTGGITYFSNMGTVRTFNNATITNNFIHGFEMATSSNTSIMQGIYSQFGADYFNNIINLGIKPDGNPVSNDLVIYGIDNKTATLNSNLYYNTIYIGGSLGNQIAKTACYHRSTTSNSDYFLNNIFINARSHSSGLGKNFCMFLTSPVNITTNFNLYYANGSGGALATVNGAAPLISLTDLQNAIIGQNLNSIAADPQLVNPANAVAPYDMSPYTASPAVGAGLSIPAVNTDYHGVVRAAFPTIGAIETPEIVNVENHNSALSLSIYPNPVASGSIVSINVDIDATELMIYNATGQEKFREKIKEKKSVLSLIGWPPGIYFVTLQISGVQHVQKLVIQ